MKFLKIKKKLVIISLLIILIILYCIFSLNIYLFLNGYKAFDYSAYGDYTNSIYTNLNGKNVKILIVNKDNNQNLILVTKIKFLPFWKNGNTIKKETSNNGINITSTLMWIKTSSYYDKDRDRYYPDFIYYKTYVIDKKNIKIKNENNLPEKFNMSVEEIGDRYLINVYASCGSFQLKEFENIKASDLVTRIEYSFNALRQGYVYDYTNYNQYISVNTKSGKGKISMTWDFINDEYTNPEWKITAQAYPHTITCSKILSETKEIWEYNMQEFGVWKWGNV